MKRQAQRQDLQDFAPLFSCCNCGGEIYRGARYYQTDQGPVCWDCLIWHARRTFFDRLREAGREEEQACV